ncbi:MAG: hypothetical protein ACOC5T_04340, partial [Elusimicrobiota bacterium]
RQTWWSGKEKLFAYYFNVVEKFDEPIKVKEMKGKKFIREIEFKNQESEKVRDEFELPKITNVYKNKEEVKKIFNKGGVFAFEKNYEGIRTIIQKKEDSVDIFVNNKDVSDKLKFLCEQIKNLSDEDLILDGTIMSYHRNEPQDKDLLKEFLFKDQELKDQDIRINVFDIPYLNKDLRNFSWHERKSKLHSLNFTKNIREAPSVIVENEEEVNKTLDMLNKLPDSKGAVIKFYNSKYPQGETTNWVKWIGEEK